MTADRDLLMRDKYAGDTSADLSLDLARLEAGEPLAYVIGWIPFLGLHINLDSRPLIPRPETEWWVEELIAHLRTRFGNEPFRLLDLCAGSGAIGLAILKAFSQAHVTFAELIPEHAEQIRKNIEINNLDATHAEVLVSDLFEGLNAGVHFDVVATNPPYVPSTRVLDASVTEFEPSEALFADTDGLRIIRRIAAEVPRFLTPNALLWMECDTSHIEAVRDMLWPSAKIRTDLYGRPRVVVAHYH